ncbi:TPA: AAA family ATPase [Citrobacter braakii]|nr:AAA family ATPase [Citrobacter braakii]
MITVQIAGAGAGKTFGLASKISERLANSDISKSVYALTYTNSARDKINNELKKAAHDSRVKIDTVHSFLLNEIIFPYSSYVLGDKYNSVSLETLPSVQNFKNVRVKNLKENGVIHVDNVYKVAKQILDRTNSRHALKHSKMKVDYVGNIITNLVCSIFIDEVQDLDEDCLKVFHILGTLGVYIYMIGDPKQAIKYPDAFVNYIEEHNKDGGVVVFEAMNNVTRRVPLSSLEFSNSLCYPDQQQTNYENKVGSVHYIYNDTPNFDSAIENALLNDKLVIINKKNDFYSTKKDKEYAIPHKLAYILEQGPNLNNRDPKIYVKSIYIDLIEKIKSDKSAPSKAAANYIIRQHDLAGLLKSYNAFGILYEFAEMCSNLGETAKYLAKSIEAIKGLDSNVVFFILNDSFYHYFDIDNIPKEKTYNKEWKKLYVALTRSNDKLVFVLDKRIISEDILKKYEEYFNTKNVSLIEDGCECLQWF